MNTVYAALVWLTRDDVGTSSRALCLRLAGITGGPTQTPCDDDDFGRCYRMLRACGSRDRVAEARDLSPAWSRLVDAWPELEALHEARETRALYTRIQQIVWQEGASC